MIRCPGCDVVYEVMFSRNPVYVRISCCPFCEWEYTASELERLERLNGERPGPPSDKVPPPARPKLPRDTIVEVEDDSEDLAGGFFDSAVGVD